MKNIAIMVSNLYLGGAERAAGLLSKVLSKYYKVYLFLLDTKNAIYDYEGEIVDLQANGEEGLENYITFCKKKYQINCAISVMEMMNFANIETKGQETVICTVHNTPSSLRLSRAGNRGIRDFYHYADQIVSVSDGVSYDLIENYGLSPKLITTIYNFIDKEMICKRASEEIDDAMLSFVGNSKLILNVGRICEEKNQIKLLTQFSLLWQEGENVKLIIIGADNGYQSKLEEYIHTLNIEPYVRLIPYTSNPFPYYRLADVFALTSNSEALPTVLFEAMLLRLPIVSVDCFSGPRELLDCNSDYKERINGYKICKNGILVGQYLSDETGKTGYFKEAVKVLLHDAALCSTIVENGQLYMQKFENDIILQQWIDIIEHTYPKAERPPVGLIDTQLLKEKKIIVYGAGLVGRGVMRHFLPRKEQLELLCFAVTQKMGEDQILGVPVFEIGELAVHKNEALVIVGVSVKYEADVIASIRRYGFRYI